MVHIIFPNNFNPDENCTYSLKKISNKEQNENDDYEAKLLIDMKNLYHNNNINPIVLLKSLIDKIEKDKNFNVKKPNDPVKKNNEPSKMTSHMYKYHNDESYRRKILDKQKEYRKYKFDTDPEYKKKCLQRVAASIKNKKIKDMEESYLNGLENGMKLRSDSAK